MTHRGVDMVVAILLLAIGGLTMYDSYQVGIGWEGGPAERLFPLLYRPRSVACECRHPGPGDRRPARTETFVDSAEFQAAF